jgi:hypothetical protein
MPKKKEQLEEKHPIDMTSEELLDCTIAPEVAERLKEMVRESEEPETVESEALS